MTFSRVQTAVMAAMAAGHVWLMAGLPVVALAHAGVDDALFIKLAAHLLTGDWLGPYDHLTLVKGPFFPLWIAFSWVVGLPLLVSEALVYAGAAWLLLAGLAGRVRKGWVLVALYGGLLLNPMLYGTGQLRAMREGLYVPMTVLILGLVVWWWRRRGSAWPRRLGLALGLGLVCGCYWIVREEGLWIVPALGVAALVGLAGAAGAAPRWRSLAGEVGLIVLAVLVAMAVPAAVKAVNHARYGVADVVEFKQDAFLDGYGALSRIVHKDWRPRVVVPREVWARAAAVSPAVAEIVPHLESHAEPWARLGCDTHAVVPCDGEIRGGWFMWSYREAVALAGYYRDAPTARAFHARLAEEIDTACRDGRLDCLPPRRTMAPPFRLDDVAETLRTLVQATVYVVTMADQSIAPAHSQGRYYNLLVFADLVRGEVFPVAPRVLLSGRAPAGTLAVAAGDGRRSLTVIQADPEPGRQRFTLETDCLADDCRLELRTADGMVSGAAISGLASAGTHRLGEAELTIDQAILSEHGRYLPNEARAALVMTVLARIGGLYRVAMPLLAVAGVIGLLYSLRDAIRHRQPGVLLPLNVVLITAIGCRLLLLSYLDVTTIPAINTLYLSPAYPLLILVSALAIIDGVQRRLDRRAIQNIP